MNASQSEAGPSRSTSPLSSSASSQGRTPRRAARSGASARALSESSDNESEGDLTSSSGSQSLKNGGSPAAAADAKLGHALSDDDEELTVRHDAVEAESEGDEEEEYDEEDEEDEEP